MIVAPFDAPKQVKQRADLVCDGTADEVELRASLDAGTRRTGAHDTSPAQSKDVPCLARHRVEWLPGTYQLSRALVIPDALDMVIEAEGSYLRYESAAGDAIVIQGMNRCRYRFGTIESRSAGAALAIRPTAAMPALQSIVTFTGLIGHGQQGVGLLLDPAEENVCVNRIEGTDVSGFAYGVRVMDPGGDTTAGRPTRKCDTNQYWLAYIRRCTMCIEEGQTGAGVDGALWTVNVDASLPGSTAIRTAACGNRWTVIMGTWDPHDTKTLVIGPGARDNVFSIRPPVAVGNQPGGFVVEDQSGNNTNRVE